MTNININILLILALVSTPLSAHSRSGLKMTKRYPLTKCVVSNEDLGPKGEYIRFIYKGQEMKVCCKPCMKKFKKDPKKHLKTLAEEVRKKKNK